MTSPGKATIPPIADEPEAELEADLGQAEALSLGRGLSVRDLRREADESDHDRNERFKGHFDKIGIFGLYAVSGALLISGLIWFIHIATPWHFLNKDQLANLQNLLTGGVLVSVGTSYIKRRLS